MIKRLFIFLPVLMMLMFGASGPALSDSKGTEFVFAFQNNHPGATDILLYITSEQNTQGVVEVPGLGFSEVFTVLAGAVTTVALPPEVRNLPSNGQSSLGIHVLADAEVTIYGMNLQRYTSDAFLALPVDALDVEYIVSSYDGLAQFASYNLNSQVAIVSTADNTLVEITPTADVAGNIAGEPFTVTLNRFDVYQLSTNVADLTGTIVKAGAPIAVMGGHKCADVPSLSRSPTGGRIGWCDHLVEMMAPVNTWGQNFSVLPLATRINGSVIRVMARDNGTLVTFNDVNAVELNAGEFFETVSNEFLAIKATAPVMVTQYSPGQGFDNVSADPFMVTIPPNEQFLQNYTFSTPETGFTINYVNLVIPTTAISSVLLNGASVDPALFSVIGTTGFSGVQLPITQAAHHLVADQPFGITVYGFNAYDSYGYPGGMATIEVNPIVDGYAPNIGEFTHIGRTLLGMATDSEDINANGVLDAGEDFNANGVLDRRTEDLNGNGILDAGEDVNNNGLIDSDQGIYKIELMPGSTNLVADITEFVSGVSPLIHFRIDLIDSTLDGVGVLKVEDLYGNESFVDINLPSTPVMVDVKLIMTVAGDRIAIDQNTFTHTPSTVDVQADNAVIEWNFTSLPVNQIENVAFDVTMIDPQPGEQRLVTQRVQLSYINAPGGDLITTELGEQSVWVSSSAFDVNAYTNQTNFGPNEDVLLTVGINNIGTALNDGSVEFVVEDINGVVVQSLPPATFGPIPAGSSVEVNRVWNTSTFIAGTYQLHAIVKDANANITNEVYVPFSVVSSTTGLPQASIGMIVGYDNSGVFVSKDVYHTTDVVQVQSRVTNLTENTHLTNTLLKVTVHNPAGQNIFTEDTVINTDLVPGVVKDITSNVLLDDAVVGTYQVQAILVDPVTSAIVATQNSSFVVEQNISLSVDGKVTATYDELLRGDIQVCTDTLNSKATQPLINIDIQTHLINFQAIQELNSQSDVITLQPGVPYTQNRNEDTSTLSGHFACVLSVDTGTGLQTLDYAWFKVYNLIAVPGSNIEALVGQNVTLDGGASREADGLPLSYQWRFVSKPENSNAQFSDTTSVTPSFFVDEQGTYVIELIVNNGSESSLPELVTVTVPNRIPVANAGPDQLVAVGDTVLLDGTASIDLDGDLLSFNWTVIQKPESSNSQLINSDTANPNISIDVAGVYRVQLVVHDGFDASVADTVLLNVGNVPPVANAGDNIAALLGDTVTLNGSASSDVNGDELSYRWFFESVPQGSNASLFNNGSIRPTFIIDLAGDYVIRLTVNDGLSDSEQDFVTVSVGNSVPVANAGQDQAGNAGNLITLDGSGSSDLNGDALTYFWTIVNKPINSNAQLNNSFVVNPNLYLDVQGDYIVQLIVNDGQVDSAPDTIFITANNLRPFAYTYFDGVGELYTGDTITLNGFDSYDPDGDPITYQWSWVERPQGSAAVLEAADTPQPFFTIDLAGNYVAQLIVNDGELSSLPATELIAGARACVENLSIRPKGNKIQLVWTDNPDTEFVEIERSNSIDGPFEVLAQTESTYATYLDSGLTAGPTYYYRIRGSFGSSQAIECDFGEGITCGNLYCFYGEVGLECVDFNSEEFYYCEQVSETSVICEGAPAVSNSCPPGDFFCQEICYEYNAGAEWILEELPEFDINLCQAPALQCRSQTIASTPIDRGVRIARVPSVIGMSLEQAQATLEQSRLTLGTVSFERTTVVPAGQVIKQDMPKDSVMPTNTAIDIVISTQGVTN